MQPEPPPPPAPPTKVEKALEICVPIFWLATLYGLYSAATSLDGWQQWATLFAALPLAWALADVLTGLTHWGLDTYGSVETPVIGQTVIKPFRMHHDFPTYMVQFDATATMALSAAAVTPLQLGLIYMASFGGWWAVAGGALMITIVGTVCTNLFHKWSHMEEPPALGRFLQRTKIALNVAEHDRHHEPPHDCSYCITCGWMNPILEKIKFFRGLERALRLLGIQPQSELYNH